MRRQARFGSGSWWAVAWLLALSTAVTWNVWPDWPVWSYVLGCVPLAVLLISYGEKHDWGPGREAPDGSRTFGSPGDG